MSLINSVLVELEQRRALPNGPQSGVLHGLDPVSERFFEREHSPSKDRVPLIAAGLLAVFAMALALNFYRSDSVDVQEPQYTPTPKPVNSSTAAAGASRIDRSAIAQQKPVRLPGMFGALSLRMDEFLRSVEPESASGTSAVPAAAPASEQGGTTLVSSLAVRATPEGIALELLISEAAAYSVYPLSDPDRLVIEIDGARLADELLPQGLSSDAITGYRPRYEDGRAVIVLDLAVPVMIADSTLQPRANGYLLAVGLERQQVSVPAMEPEPSVTVPEAGMQISASPAPSGARTGAETSAEFQHATRMYQDGRVAEGLSYMVDALSRNPDDAAGRTLLANKLIEQRDYSRAVAVLDAGLAREPRHWQWTMLKAQVLNARNNTALAVALLDGNLAAANQAPEYLELLAGLLQKTGDHAAAAGHYQRLVQVDSGRGLWWLGLGISRQALAEQDAARQAFDMALRDPALRPDLRKFAQARLQTLDHS